MYLNPIDVRQTIKVKSLLALLLFFSATMICYIPSVIGQTTNYDFYRTWYSPPSSVRYFKDLKMVRIEFPVQQSNMIRLHLGLPSLHRYIEIRSSRHLWYSLKKDNIGFGRICQVVSQHCPKKIKDVLEWLYQTFKAASGAKNIGFHIVEKDQNNITFFLCERELPGISIGCSFLRSQKGINMTGKIELVESKLFSGSQHSRSFKYLLFSNHNLSSLVAVGMEGEVWKQASQKSYLFLRRKENRICKLQVPISRLRGIPSNLSYHLRSHARALAGRYHYLAITSRQVWWGRLGMLVSPWVWSLPPNLSCQP